MNHWEPIASAPYDRELELAVIERAEVHGLVFGCRRTSNGWVDARNGVPIFVHPTHWRYWMPHQTNGESERYLNPAR